MTPVCLDSDRALEKREVLSCETQNGFRGGQRWHGGKWSWAGINPAPTTAIS